MATLLDNFLPEIMPEVPGVPYPVAINALRNACFDFCKRSLWWNAASDTTAFASGTASYTLDSIGSNTVIIGVLHATLDSGAVIYPQSFENATIKALMASSITGEPGAFVSTTPNTIQFVPTPNRAGTFVAQLAYAPSRTATTIDDNIYTYWLETIKAGALWKLKQMSNQPWSDPQGAQLQRQQFMSGVNQAYLERVKSGSHADMVVQMQRWI